MKIALLITSLIFLILSVGLLSYDVITDNNTKEVFLLLSTAGIGTFLIGAVYPKY